MIRFIPDTRGMAWEDWVAAFIGYNSSLHGQVDQYSVPWQDFGRRLTLVDANVPRPDFFESWQAWAQGLQRALGV